MKRDILNRSELSLKFTAVVVAAMIVISSAAMIEVMINASPENEAEPSFVDQSFQSRTCKATSIPAQEGDWITADSSLEGTPAEAHVTVSDTSGITIVVDFHGFWLNNCTIDSTSYYDLNMPGASSIQAYGKPVLPCLFEFVQIPYDVDIEVDVLSSTSANVSEYISDYEIKPGPFPEFPSPIGEGDEDVSSTIEPALFFDPVYSNGTLFPGITTSTEGELNSTSMIMRGHRLLGLSFYPVQYNNATSELILYSQLIVKVKYSFPAQINPIPKHLCSKPFERIIDQTVLNCRASEMELYIPGIGEVIQYIIPELFFKGAEYLIITNSTFEDQANRLADWKERKGLLSDVQVIPDYVVDVRNYVKNFLNFVYYHWYPAPTYVLLMGDVEAIPTNYDMDHNGMADGTRFFEPGSSKIASDFGYFNIEGNGYFPDMIYSRISVDTELQAEIIVNKTLLYEQSPPADTTFYENFLSAGYFQDKPPDPYTPRDGTEDVNYPMIYTLERIRHYLNHTLGYNAHINYSSAINDQIPLLFQKELNGDADVAVSIGRENYFPNFAWLEGYDWSGKWGRDYYYELERGNITPNFNEGRFLVLYFGHGGSKNMYNPINILSGYQPNPETEPGVFAVDYRDVVEGWQHPCLNTSFFADLTNGDLTPLVISIACNTGWFDGETDQDYLSRDNFEVDGDQNAFAEYANECFAENLTRLEGGGAIAVIASSRQAYAPISSYLLDGLVQAFWPGFLESNNQPIYEMGGALLFSKIYAVSEYSPTDDNLDRMMVEEYHLFGDPETQLWTDVPTGLIVEYPEQIGIGDQEFVVTVRANSSIHSNYSIALPNAKVCLQKGSDIYQVGYTNSQGQVLFKVHPSYPGMMNLTVTAHNYIPHIGEMEVVCSGATLTLTPEEGPASSSVRFNVHGFFENEDVEIYYERLYVVTLTGGASTNRLAPTIRYGFVNIIAKGVDSNLVAVAVYRRYIHEPRPDLYIYSQWDESTWELPGVTIGDIGWFNPAITIFDGINQVGWAERLSSTTSYIVRILVRNRYVDAWNTKVTLKYAPIGGGVTWDYAGEDFISRIHPGSQAYAYIRWQPPKAGDYCLKAIIENTNDRNLDNNIGVLAVNVVEYSSPAFAEFIVGNPSDTNDYVFICVKQQGNYSDVWNATIMDYSSQIINSTHNETISIQISPESVPEENEWRLFVANIYVNCKLVGGISFNVTKSQITTTPPPDGLDPIAVALILGGIGAGVAVVIFAYKKSKKGT